MSKKRVLTEEEKIKVKLAKKELNQYRNDTKYILEKINDAEETQTLLEKVTTAISPGKTGSVGVSKDKFADGINKLEELKNSCINRTQKLLINKFRIDDKIDLLPMPYRDVLFYRYSRRMKWENVAFEMGYDKKYVCDELHPEALYLYSKFLNIKIGIDLSET